MCFCALDSPVMIVVLEALASLFNVRSFGPHDLLPLVVLLEFEQHIRPASVAGAA